MFRSRSFPVHFAIFIAVLLLIYLHTASSPFGLGTYSTELFDFAYHHPQPPSIELREVYNASLGFEKVFAVGLAERSDKRDALALASSLTGFKVEWIDGVHGEDVPDKALPLAVDRGQLWETNLGSWRGHMNAVRRIVENGYTSALVLEDDMDFDVRLKAQLLKFAQGARSIQSSFPSPPFSVLDSHISPYGNNWDLLWLGHCGEVFPESLPEQSSKDSSELIALSRKYIISPDPTIPPPKHAIGFQNFTSSPLTRWIHVSGGPICSYSYALSREGARKVLYALSVDGLTGAFDNALAGLCRWGREGNEGREKLDMRCVSATPGYFSSHRAKGEVAKDSDIQKNGKLIRDKGFTENIVWSVRMNLGNLLAKRKMVSQFEGVSELESGGL